MKRFLFAPFNNDTQEKNYEERIFLEMEGVENECHQYSDRSTNFCNFVEPTVEIHINESMEIHDDSPVPIFEVSINNGVDADTTENEDAPDDQFCDESNAICNLAKNDYRIKLNDLCRVCGKSSDDKIDIFGPEGCKQQLEEKIKKHLPIVVTKNDKLPLQMCFVCVMQLDIWHKLVECCKETEKNLNCMVSKEDLEASVETQETGLECLNHPEYIISSFKKDSTVNNNQNTLSQIKTNKGSEKCIKVVVVRLKGSDHELKHAQQEVTSSTSSLASLPYFHCTSCNQNLEGTDMVVKHQKEVHNVTVYVCQWCNELFDTQTSVESHQLEKHLGDSIKVINVAEIQLMKEGALKVSKEFDQMEKSLQCKIVDAIQVMVGQKIPKEKRPLHCSICKQPFDTFAALQEHRVSAHDDLKSFTCNFCQNRFLTKRMLLRHITEHAEYKAFRCPECHKGYNTKVGYTIHLTTHNTEKPFICPECGKSFKHGSNLKAHQKSHLPDDQKKRFKCPQCEKKFRCQFLVDEHMRTHTGERPFSCEACSKTFHRKQQLAQHLLVHRTDLTFECHLCGSRFNRKGNLTEHMKKHVSKSQYVCKVCKESFDSVSGMVAHRKGHSAEEYALVKAIKKTPATIFECEFCKKVLASKTSLVAHLRIHTGEKPFECDICGKKFSQKPALNYHKKLHSTQKPFQCTYCPEGFVTRTARAVHERIHTNEKPYTCQFCGASFRGSSSLNQHLILHNDERPFQCSHCTRAFRRKEALQIHERIHTGQKPYACDTCGRAFTQRGDLAKHKKTHTNSSRLHSCRVCNFVCTNRKSMKKHESIHALEGNHNLIAENLLTSFSEVQDCDMMLGSDVIEVEQIQL